MSNPEDVVKKYLAAFGNDVDTVMSLTDPNYVLNSPFLGSVKGKDASRKVFETFFKAFPNWKVTILSIVSKGNLVGVEVSTGGTFTGPLVTPEGTIPPNGRHAEFTAAEFYRVSPEGLIMEDRPYYDTGVMRQQLGLG